MTSAAPDTARQPAGPGPVRHHAGVDVAGARRAAAEVGRSVAAPATTLPLAECLGAVLAEPLRALVDAPAADTSAMDGFAVRGPGSWRVRARVLAGATPSAPLGDGDAAEVATGAVVPAGTERVLPAEDVDADGGRVAVRGALPARRHVRARGEQVTAGTVLLPAGHRVAPATLGLAASAGADALTVRTPTRVAVLLTGDEVVTHGVPAPGEVRDAVGPSLPGLVAHLGGRLVHRSRSDDAVEQLHPALESLLAVEADVVMTCGMAGAGPADHLRPWLRRVGARLVVDGVAVRPGHPMLLAVLPDGRPLVGLPGNPLAAVAALLVLLGPLLAGATGRAPATGPRASLAGEVPSGRPVTALVPVRWAGAPGVVEPAGPAGPAQLWGLACADAVAVVPSGGSDDVELLLLP
ncbi:molybdopterin molybdotransferase MoeA [Aquipuribacter sp. SD81]|uniref:molybdopterin molybdotransferase MoeA n=1 Tax=Aquipuribacter sp. SD81 TaxID=3127703 RepID=UPI0030167718